MFKHGELDEQQVRRAAIALLRYVKRSAADNKRDLLADDGKMITALLTMHTIPDHGVVKTKPMRVPIPHPLRTLEDCDMCIFVKDEAKGPIKKMMEEKPVDGLKKVIKLQRLRTQYFEFKHRRELLSQYNFFLCDDRIMPMLTKALGSTFLRCKKHPVPIRFRNLNLFRKHVQAARESAYLIGSYGESWSVKLARTNMTVDEVTANLMAGIPAAVNRMPRKWKGIKSISIVCHNTVALPVYTSLETLPVYTRLETLPEAASKADEEEAKSSKPPPKVPQQQSEKPSLLLVKNLKRMARAKANGGDTKRRAESTPAKGRESKKARHTEEERPKESASGPKMNLGEKVIPSLAPTKDGSRKPPSTNGGVINGAAAVESRASHDAKTSRKRDFPRKAGVGHGKSASADGAKTSATVAKRRDGKVPPLVKKAARGVKGESTAPMQAARLGRGNVGVKKQLKRRRAVV